MRQQASNPLPPTLKQQDPEHRIARSLLAASLLAVTGGGLDAFVYLNHGQVFAAAMTGNTVLLGIAVLSHNTRDVFRHLIPLIAFFAGVWGAELLVSHFKRHAVTVGLLCELFTLFAASWLPRSFPDIYFVPIIAFAAAYQVASFRTVDTYAYNSTFVTGNLRTAVDGLHATLNPKTRAAGLKKFFELATIIASFLAGALLGAVLAPRFANHTLWFLELPLVVVFVLALSRDIPSR
jgi:uncharacterized membrane protein YoaK (UPF0700 family)